LWGESFVWVKTKHRRYKVTKDSERSRSVKERLHSTALTTSRHLCFGYRGSARRVREIKWTPRQIIDLALLIAIFAGGCIEIALWLNTHPIPE
jgi:hypothetical protein